MLNFYLLIILSVYNNITIYVFFFLKEYLILPFMFIIKHYINNKYILLYTITI